MSSRRRRGLQSGPARSRRAVCRAPCTCTRQDEGGQSRSPNAPGRISRFARAEKRAFFAVRRAKKRCTRAILSSSSSLSGHSAVPLRARLLRRSLCLYSPSSEYEPSLDAISHASISTGGIGRWRPHQRQGCGDWHRWCRTFSKSGVESCCSAGGRLRFLDGGRCLLIFHV